MHSKGLESVWRGWALCPGRPLPGDTSKRCKRRRKEKNETGEHPSQRRSGTRRGTPASAERQIYAWKPSRPRLEAEQAPATGVPTSVPPPALPPSSLGSLHSPFFLPNSRMVIRRQGESAADFLTFLWFKCHV